MSYAVTLYKQMIASSQFNFRNLISKTILRIIGILSKLVYLLKISQYLYKYVRRCSNLYTSEIKTTNEIIYFEALFG